MRFRIAVAAAVASALVVPLTAVEASAAPQIRFSFAQYDSPGSDGGSNSSLNAEWVRVKNFGRTARTLTGWTIRDPQGHVYKFPKFTLKPGKSVTLHTGSGSNTAANKFWRQDFYVWNNTGDRAILKTKSGSLVDTCKWGDGDGTTVC
jgi:hypothetical protein